MKTLSLDVALKLSLPRPLAKRKATPEPEPLTVLSRAVK